MKKNITSCHSDECQNQLLSFIKKDYGRFKGFRNKCGMTQSCKAFTLVELIVVITILAILGTIAFISLQGYSSSARDTKRLSDVKSLITKITIENTKGVDLSQLIITETGYSMPIYGEPDNVIIGTPNFKNLNENSGSFVDPKDKSDYLMAYSIKTQRVAGMYKSETTGKNVCVGEIQLFKNYAEKCDSENNGNPGPEIPPEPPSPPFGGQTTTLCNDKYRSKLNGAMIWDNAISSCNSNGFRLPSKDELTELYSAVCMPSLGLEEVGYWSSTEGEYSDQAWIVLISYIIHLAPLNVQKSNDNVYGVCIHD